MKMLERQVLNQGRIAVFKRDNSLKGIWHYRLKIRKKSGYVIRSTKTPDIHEAMRIAQDDFDTFSLRVADGREILQDVKFRKLWKMFCNAHQVDRSSIHRKKLYEGNGSRYFVPFFGDMRIEAITDTTVDDYWQFRLNYWSNQTVVPATAKRQPGPKTLEMEAQMLRQFFGWANLKGYLQKELTVAAPLPKLPTKDTRHPAFDRDQWPRLCRRLAKWCDEPRTATRGPNEIERSHRRIFSCYVLFMANSGLRPNEARQLRWADVQFVVDKDGRRTKVKIVVPAGKTGKRICIPTKNAKSYLDDLRKLSKHTAPSDPVFCFEDGKPIAVGTMSAKFSRFLKGSDLATDRQGNPYTLYSLRHTYATFRLLAKIDVLLLAQNMGTSAKMIEDHYSHIKTEQFADVLSEKEEADFSNALWDDEDYQ